ncbi:MAG: DUF3854 domain-containing protein [Moorea sp. SIO4G2]|nr:DUF3854 domain-containing protein [Moorena sp. SIO4G2]
MPHLSQIAERHLQEWRESGVNDEIIALNVTSLSGQEAIGRLFVSSKLERRNDGRVASYLLRHYEHVEAGGWACTGEDIVLGGEDDWCCFKPDRPRENVKYEHPPKTPTKAFFLRIGQKTLDRIVEKQGLDYSGSPEDFWRYVLESPTEVVITEGAKKAGALLSAGYTAIAVSGCWNGLVKDEVATRKLGSPVRRLKPDLKILTRVSRKIVIAFDKDSRLASIKSVRHATSCFSKALKDRKCEVAIADWKPTLGKGCDDFITSHGVTAFDEVMEKAVTFSVWTSQYLKTLKQKPDVELDCEYLDRDLLRGVSIGRRLIGLKSPKGTGKTESFIRAAADAILRGERVLVATHRIQLTEALCTRLTEGLQKIAKEWLESGIISLFQVTDFVVKYVTKVPSVKDRNVIKGMGLCLDSLHPKSQATFYAEEWKDAFVIFDESEQSFHHMLNSMTCKSSRVPILRSFKELVENASCVVLADADLSSLSLDYVSAFMREEPFIIRNNWLLEPWTIHNIEEESAWAYLLEQHIKDGGRPFVCLSGQKARSLWGTKNLEHHLKQKFPNLKILRIDSKTVGNPLHPAYGCIPKLNEMLGEYDIVLASPSIETGVSIEVDHFTSVWGFFVGVQGYSSVCQAISRVRKKVPRFLHVAVRGIGGICGGVTSVKELLATQERITRKNIKLLTDAGLRELQDVDEDEIFNFQPISLLTWANMIVRHNAGMIGYRDQVLGLLEEEGHVVVPFGDDIDGSMTKQELKESRDIVYEAERTAIATVTPFQNEKEYKLVESKHSKTEEEEFQVVNWETNKRWGSVTPEILEKQDRGFYEKYRRLYYATNGKRFAVETDKYAIAAQLEQNDGDLFLPDANRNNRTLTAIALEYTGILDIIKSTTDWHSDSPEVIEIYEKVRPLAARKQFASIGLFSFSEKDSKIQVVKKLLAKIGIDLKATGKRLSSRKSTRHYLYRIKEWEHEVSPVLGYWEAQDIQKETRRKQREAERAEAAAVAAIEHREEISQKSFVTSQLSDLGKEVLNWFKLICPEQMEEAVETITSQDYWEAIADEVWVNASVGIRQALNRFSPNPCLS